MKPDNALSQVEELFEKYGALPANEVNAAREPHFELRPSYVRNGIYYRAEETDLDGRSVIILYATDQSKMAEIGTEDSIAAFLADLPEEKLEKEVRFALGVEPYPETYPTY